MLRRSVRGRPSQSVTKPNRMPPVAQPTRSVDVMAPVAAVTRGSPAGTPSSRGTQTGATKLNSNPSKTSKPQPSHAAREVGQAALVHRSAAGRGAGRCGEVEELDADAVPLEVDGMEVDARETQQRVARLARDPQLVLGAEAEEVAIEPERSLHVGDADADVGQAEERDHRVAHGEWGDVTRAREGRGRGCRRFPQREGL